MNMIWKKVFLDFWASKSKTILALLALMVGAWGASTIVYTYYISKKDLHDNYIRTNPASAVLRLDTVGESLLKEIKDLDFVADAEILQTGIARVKRRNGQWMPIWIFASKDFKNRNINSFSLEQGAYPSQGNILIERDGLQYLAEAKLEVQIANNEVLNLNQSGVVHDAGLPPSHMDHIIWGYAHTDTYAQLFRKHSSVQLLVVFSKDRFQLSAIQKNADLLTQWLKARNLKVSQVIIPAPGKHPHDEQLQSLLFLQLGMGVLAVILSCTLLINVVTSLMTSQVKQIGVMKAIGASSFQVSGMYLGGIMLMASIAIGLALPLGFATAKAYNQFIANELNFDLINDQIPLWLNASLVGFLLILPLASVLPTINKACKISVKDALNYEKTSADSAKEGLRLPIFVPLWFKIAFSNVFRNKWGTALTVFNLMLGLALFAISLNVRRSMSNTFFTTLSRQKYDVSIHLEKAYPQQVLQQSLAKIPEIEQVGYWAVSVLSFDNRGMRTSDFKLTLFDENSPLLKFDFMEGQVPNRWDRALLVNPQFMKKHPEVSVGDSLSLSSDVRVQKWYIAGVIKEVDEMGAYTTLSSWSQISGEALGCSSLKLKVTKDLVRSELPAFMMRVEQQLKADGIGITDNTNQAEVLKVLNDHINVIITFLIFMAILVLVIGGLGMVSTMNINIMERKREIGIMRAMGGSKYAIARLVFVEILVLGILSWLIGWLVSLPLSRIISDFFGLLILDAKLDFVTDPSSPKITLVLVLVILFLASIFPIANATKIAVHKALNEN